MQHEKNILCFDFDGTLCEDWYPAIGRPNMPIIALMTKLHQQGFYIIVNSSRQTIDYEPVQSFLCEYGVPCDQLCLGAKPVADLYIDDKSLWAEPRLLEMLIEQRFMAPDEYMLAMAKERLISAFAKNMYDVPEVGGGKQRDGRFTIGLAMTGGMDSTTLWKMLEESGLPYRMLYFDMGQVYAKAEQAAICEITGREAEVYAHPMPFTQHKHILSGRNAIILLHMAYLLTQNGGWGEIWFGNVQGESPVIGGDKSRRFFNDMAVLFAFRGLDVRIVNPLMGMDKTDEVLYWKERDLSVLKKTKSCFAADAGQCGRCQACFLKWTAFASAGVDCSDIFPITRFEPYVGKYKHVLAEALANRDFTHYSPGRIRHTLEAIAAYEAAY